MPQSQQPLIRKHGGFRKLTSFMMSTIVYYGTVSFCRRFVKSSRQSDQMTQAARSGRQNIAEGSERAGTSSETEIQLTDVARASLVELLLDLEDFLLLQDILPWSEESAEAKAVSAVQVDRFDFSGDISHAFGKQVLVEKAKFARWLDADDPVIVANALINLCHRTLYFLRRQVDALGQRFLDEGGFKEHMRRCREETRAKAVDAPECPSCGKPMRQCTAKTGPKTGQPFWGCSAYPACKGTREFEPKQ